MLQQLFKCAILRTQKKQLDDNMLFTLSSLSSQAYALYKKVVQSIENGKGTSVKHSRGIGINTPDCKGNDYRGLNENEILNILQNFSNSKIRLEDVNTECTNLKKLKRIKEEAFFNQVGETSWSDAMQNISQICK